MLERKLAGLKKAAVICRSLAALREQDRSFVEDLIRQASTYNYLSNQFGDQLASTADQARPINQNARQIWRYWNKGFGDAPKIVQACTRSVEEYKGSLDVQNLSFEQINNFVDFPGYIFDKLRAGLISQAHFSDILRATLLANHGGVWIDATVLLTAKIPDKILRGKLFAFSTPPSELLGSPYLKASSWFIHANGSECCRRLCQRLLEYWRRESCLQHYYLFHICFAQLIDSVPACGLEWASVEFETQIYPHLLQFALPDRFDADRFNTICEKSFAHKLTHYGVSRSDVDYSFEDHLLCEPTRS
jgi:hypothetical protein